MNGRGNGKCAFAPLAGFAILSPSSPSSLTCPPGALFPTRRRLQVHMAKPQANRDDGSGAGYGGPGFGMYGRGYGPAGYGGYAPRGGYMPGGRGGAGAVRGSGGHACPHETAHASGVLGAKWPLKLGRLVQAVSVLRAATASVG